MSFKRRQQSSKHEPWFKIPLINLIWPNYPARCLGYCSVSHKPAARAQCAVPKAGELRRGPKSAAQESGRALGGVPVGARGGCSRGERHSGLQRGHAAPDLSLPGGFSAFRAAFAGEGVCVCTAVGTGTRALLCGKKQRFPLHVHTHELGALCMYCPDARIYIYVCVCVCIYV